MLSRLLPGTFPPVVTAGAQQGAGVMDTLAGGALADSPAAAIGGITGTLAITLDGVTVAVSGTNGHSATLAATLGDATTAISGTNGHTGTSAITLDTIAFDASGTVTSGSASVTGTLAITLDDIGFDASGTVPDAVPTKVGGDDAFHPGWNKKAWKKKQVREQAVEETIRETYNRIMGIEPDPVLLEEVKQEALQEAPKPATFDYSGVTEWLQAQQVIVAQILAKQAEEDDEETLLLLM